MPGSRCLHLAMRAFCEGSDLSVHDDLSINRGFETWSFCAHNTTERTDIWANTDCFYPCYSPLVTKGYRKSLFLEEPFPGQCPVRPVEIMRETTSTNCPG